MRKYVILSVVSALALAWAAQTSMAGACWGASPATYAVLAGRWQSASRISPSTGVTTGDNAEDGTSAEKPMADKPMMIYVRDEAEVGGFDTIEKVVLDNNQVLVGMHAFRCVKMTPSDIQDDPLLADEGKELPRFIFVSRDYSDIKVIEGSKIKAKALFAQMTKLAKKEYGVNLKKCYKDTMKLLNEFDKINSAMKTLKEKRARGELSKSDEKKMAKEEAELNERQKKADELKEKLLKFEPKKKA